MDDIVVMVYDDFGEAIGIFTSKDLLRRTLATGRDPSHCLVSEAMTPNPDYASLDTTIVDALHIMHDGKFLHLPVVGRNGKVVGLTDVLQVTYGVVNQMGSLHQSNDESEVAVWRNFWNSVINNEDSSTVGSTIGSTLSGSFDCGDLSSPRDYVSSPRNDDEQGYYPSHEEEIHESPPYQPDVFTYKILDSDGFTHRFSSAADSVEVHLRAT